MDKSKCLLRNVDLSYAAWRLSGTCLVPLRNQCHRANSHELRAVWQPKDRRPPISGFLSPWPAQHGFPSGCPPRSQLVQIAQRFLFFPIPAPRPLPRPCEPLSVVLALRGLPPLPFAVPRHGGRPEDPLAAGVDSKCAWCCMRSITHITLVST